MSISLMLLQLLLFGCVLHQYTAQELVIQPPGPAVAALGSNISFSCSGYGTILWEIRGIQVSTISFQEIFRNSLIYVPLPQDDESEMTVTATTANNDTTTTIVCILDTGLFDSLIRSNTKTLVIYGAPSPPSNLITSLPSQGLGVTLSWTPGFAFEGERVTFVVTSLNLALGTSTETRVNSSSVTLTPPHEGRTCPEFRFTVQSENDFSRNTSSISEEIIIPTVPYVLEEEEVLTSLLFSGGLLVNVSFNAPSPCPEFSVQEYILHFYEVRMQSSISVTHNSTERFVSIMVGDLLPGRQYNFTITAINTAGSTQSNNFSLFTTGLQSSVVILDASSSVANITCTFAAGSTALGCYVLLGSAQVNVSRDPETDVAEKTVILSDEVADDMAVTVAEVLLDGTVGSITFLPDIVRTISTSTAIPPTSTHSLPTTTTTTFTTEQETSSSSSPSLSSSPADTIIPFLSGNTLFIMIGVIAGVVILLLLIIIVFICVIRINCKKRKSSQTLALDSAEELKISNVYEVPSPPVLQSIKDDYCEIKGNNVYDTPQLLNGVTASLEEAPTYETIQSAVEQKMLITRGQVVLNPVYGPTGVSNTSASTTSPVPIPSQAANISATNPLDVTMVSALCPVYASFDNAGIYPSHTVDSIGRDATSPPDS